jgi:hypothetical protein
MGSMHVNSSSDGNDSTYTCRLAGCQKKKEKEKFEFKT